MEQKPDYEKVVHKIYHNASGDYDVAMINRTTKINVNGILIEYEGEDSGIGLLFASKAAVQVLVIVLVLSGVLCGAGGCSLQSELEPPQSHGSQ